DGVEDLFHSRRARPISGDHVTKFAGDLLQAVFQWRLRAGSNDAGEYQAVRAPVALDNAVARPLGTAIDPQNAHVTGRMPPVPFRPRRNSSKRSARRRAPPGLRSNAAWRRRSCLRA